MIADDSSRVTGCLTVAELAFWLLPGATAGRSKAPEAVSAATVPPDARTAAARAAAMTVAAPAPRRGCGVTGRAATGAAVSNQCSGVGSFAAHWAWVQVRGSGAGEYEAAPLAAVPPGAGAASWRRGAHGDSTRHRHSIAASQRDRAAASRRLGQWGDRSSSHLMCGRGDDAGRHAESWGAPYGADSRFRLGAPLGEESTIFASSASGTAAEW